MSIMSAQVSLYPLRKRKLSTAIDEAQRIFYEHGLQVTPSSMSTVITGAEEAVFMALQAAFRRTAGQGQVVMVATFSNACPQPEIGLEQHKIRGGEKAK